MNNQGEGSASQEREIGREEASEYARNNKLGDSLQGREAAVSSIEVATEIPEIMQMNHSTP